MAQLLYKANCSSAMLFGTTLDDAVLERNQPHYRRENILKMAGLLQRADVPYMLGLMFGGIGETLKGVEDTLETTLSLKPVMLVSGVGFRLQPDTPLFRHAQERGLIDPEEDGFEAKFFMAEDAPAEEVHKRIRRFQRAHPFHKLRMVSFVLRSIKEGIFGRA